MAVFEQHFQRHHLGFELEDIPRILFQNIKIIDFFPIFEKLHKRELKRPSGNTGQKTSKQKKSNNNAIPAHHPPILWPEENALRNKLLQQNHTIKGKSRLKMIKTFHWIPLMNILYIHDIDYGPLEKNKELF